MKTKFEMLRWTLLLTVFRNVLVAIASWFVVTYLINVVFRNPIVMFIEWFGMHVLNLSREGMQLWYDKVFRTNTNLIFSVIMALLIIFFLYRAFSKVSGYLNKVNDAMDIVVARDNLEIVLPTVLKPIADKMNNAKQIILNREQEALQAEQRKNDLVVYLAHDLKTPLTSVIGYVNLLQDIGACNAQLTEKYTEIALQKANRLEELINEFFEIARYNVQDMELQRSSFNLSVMLRQLADEMYPMLSEKEMEIKLELEDICVFADSDKLARVFGNLLKNAVSYSFVGGQILVCATAEHGNAKVSIANNGAKIPEGELNNIFSKFYRLDAARSSKTGSAGLGLAIAKEIILRHGGEIVAVSDDIKTEFITTIPIN